MNIIVETYNYTKFIFPKSGARILLKSQTYRVHRYFAMFGHISCKTTFREDGFFRHQLFAQYEIGFDSRRSGNIYSGV